MKLVSVGIDILSRKRAAQLLKSHSKQQINRLLTSSEKKKRLTPLYLAKLLCAKEAFLKASEGLVMVWNQIEVKVLPGQHFKVQSTRSNSSKGPITASGAFFQSSTYVGAQVILWRS